MQKLTVLDAAEKLGISKEAIYNRIRRGTIKSVEENNIKYVILDEILNHKDEKNPISTHSSKNSDFVQYLIAQIEELKAKNKLLEEDKKFLYKQKEEILISSKDEIKLMYKERDEKLQYFLSLFEKPLLNRQKNLLNEEHNKTLQHKEEINWISLGKYVKTLNLKKYNPKKTKKLLIKNIGKSSFIRVDNGVLYVDEKINLQSLKEKK